MADTTTERSGTGRRLPAGWGFARIVAVAGGVFFAVGGVWAMVDTRGFFDAAATFEPYNTHLIRDVGAFQIGLGAVLLLAAARPVLDGLTVGLLGVGIGSVAHLVSHVVDRDRGGQPEVDIPFFALLTILLLVAGGLRWRDTAA